MLKLFRYEFKHHERARSQSQPWFDRGPKDLDVLYGEGWRIESVMLASHYEMLLLLKRRRWRWQK